MKSGSNKLQDKLIIGRLGKPRGLRGELKVFPLTEDPQRFKKLKKCFLEDSERNVQTELQVIKSSVSGNNIHLQFQGINNREQAETLKNLYLSVARKDAIKLEEDSWFIADLIGCEVYDHDHGYLGTIRMIDSNSNADVISVQEKNKNDLLFPNLKTIVRKVDIEGRRVDVILPDGLYEIYRED